MSATKHAKKAAKDSQVVTLRLSGAIADKTADAVSKTGLRKADVLRLAVDRGVDVLLKQLTEPVSATPAA